MKYLKGKGYRIDEVGVDCYGKVKLDELKSMLGDDVALVSVMWANNETGTIQDVKEAAELAHSCGAYFHSDATQAIGKIPVYVKDCGIDYLSLSAHKFYGPKGIGVLYAAAKAPLKPFVHGGHQEGGLRAGTYNTLNIIGLGEAAKLAREGLKEEYEKLYALREKPSYVLLASGLDVELAHGSIRFSLGRYNTESDIDYTLEKLPAIIERVRTMSTRKGFDK